MLVNLNDKPLEDIDIVTLGRPSTASNERSMCQPGTSGHVIATPARLGEAVDLGSRPTAHRETLAPVGDGGMTSLAHVADEGFVFDTNGGEPEFLRRAAIWTDAVGRETGQFLDGKFCLWVRHGLAFTLERS